MAFSLLAALLLSCPLVLVTPQAARSDVAPAPGNEAIPETGSSLSGREIYGRYLDNRFQESYQLMRVISRDPGGSEQLTHFDLRFKDFRDEQRQPVKNVTSKMLIRVSAPFDMRHAAYLIISKDPGPDDEFAYQPSQRRVRRLDLKNTSLFGTDYSFNDIMFQKLEDAEYTRLEDEEIDGVPVYVVEANVQETIDVEFHRTVSYIEQEHHIPLRIRYWDDFGVEVKEMRAPHEKLRAFGNTWVATESTMTDLRQKTSSSIYVDDLDSEPDFHEMTFAVGRLAQGH